MAPTTTPHAIGMLDSEGEQGRLCSCHFLVLSPNQPRSVVVQPVNRSCRHQLPRDLEGDHALHAEPYLGESPFSTKCGLRKE
jgi:hypothetical protein